MIKLIIFDWDDVITLGSSAGYYACYHQALEKVGVNLDPKEERERIDKNWGGTDRQEIEGLLLARPDLVDAALAYYNKALLGETFISHLTAVPGAAELLDRLARRYRLAIATGMHPDLLIKRVMPKFNIHNVFVQIESVFNIPQPEYSKPHPYLVEAILTRQQISPTEAVLVGDAGGDVEMARRAGVMPIVVLTGHLNQAEAAKLGVKHIITDVTKLEEVLTTL